MRLAGILLTGGAIAALVLLTGFAPSPVYVVGALATLLAGWMVHEAAGLSPRRLTIPGIWLISYLTVAVVPGFFVAADKHTPYVTPFMTALLSTLITVPAGMLLARGLAGFHRREVQEFYDAPMVERAPTSDQSAAFLLILGISFALAAGYVIEAPVIPLLYLIRNPGAAAALVGLREESFKLLDSPLIYVYDVLRRVGFPFLICVALGWYLVSRQRRWLLLFLLTGGVGLVYAALTAAKMPVAVIVLTAALGWYLHIGGRVSLRAVFLGFCAVFLFPVFVLVQSLSGLGIGADVIAKGIFHRLFYVPAEILYYYFEVVPDVVPYLHGRTIGRINWLLGSEAEVNIANYVFRYMFPWRVDTGLAPAPFIGYLHADFGIVGVLAGGVLAGMILEGLQVIVTRRPKTVVTLAGYAYLLWCGWKLNMESMTQSLLSGGIFIILALMELMRITEGFLRIATARPRLARR
jgi:oligosaccharide repeat unit polymerase